MIELTCRACSAPFAVDRRDLLAGPVTHCPDCRAPDASPARACPVCGKWLESGRHRNGHCPGRRRRRRVPWRAADAGVLA